MKAAVALLLGVPAAFACQIPELPLMYQPLARQARISGAVTAAVAWDQIGKLTVERKQGHALLYRSIEDAVSKTTFVPDCAERSLEITVEFGFLDCYFERTYSQTERTSPTSWRVSVGKPYAIASGDMRVRRAFPLFFLHKTVAFCHRYPTDGTPCPVQQ